MSSMFVREFGTVASFVNLILAARLYIEAETANKPGSSTFYYVMALIQGVDYKIFSAGDGEEGESAAQSELERLMTCLNN